MYLKYEGLLLLMHASYNIVFMFYDNYAIVSLYLETVSVVFVIPLCDKKSWMK